MKLSDIVSPHLSPRKKRARLLICVGTLIEALAQLAKQRGEGGGAIGNLMAAGGTITLLVGLYYLLTKDPPPPLEPDAPQEPLPEPYRFKKRFVPLEDERPVKPKKKKRKAKPPVDPPTEPG